MVLKLLILTCAAAAATLAAGPAAASTSEDELRRALAGVAHTVPVPIAFYEKAPLLMRASMRSAVEAACGDHEARQPNPVPGDEKLESPTEWLCSRQPLAYLRAVYVTGERGMIGYVCNSEDIASFRYYPPDSFAGRRCVPIWYRKETRRHFIDPGDIRAAQ